MKLITSNYFRDILNERRENMAKVYFTDLSTKPSMSLLKKVLNLINKAGIENIIEEGNMTAIKIHFGEYGNLAYVRPNYVRVIVDRVKELGGKPFVTDANTLYRGHRSDAVNHLETALLNGFAYQTIGAPVIIADGLRGSDEVKVPINEEYVKEAKIGSAVALSDVVIAITHFKGHEQTGFGGVIKNIGMGAASRAGKMEQHSDSKPQYSQKKCVSCKMCERNCNYGAISVDPVIEIDYDKCVGCGQCIAMCNYGAIYPDFNTSGEGLCKKMAEYTKAALMNKKGLYISFINNISPNCDCWPMNEPPIAPDIGIAVSIDPVALDQACIDLVIDKVGHDPFKETHPNTNWEYQLDYAEKIGLGSRKYKLEKLYLLK